MESMLDEANLALQVVEYVRDELRSSSARQDQ
jgi:hypothetical protein